MTWLIHSLLIAIGALGLIVSLPVAAYGWMMHVGFGGSLTLGDQFLLCSPLFFAVALIVGLCWRRCDQERDANTADLATTKKGELPKQIG